MKFERIIATTALAGGLLLAPLAQAALAQTTAPDAGATAVPETTTTTSTQTQQNFNYGWLGLLGLFGLGGLMRRSPGSATYVERP